MSFENRVAFVTGGASGIGLAVAIQLIEAGARVTIFDRNPVPREQLPGDTDRLLAVTGDAGSASDLREAMKLTVERFGGLDFGVNAAGTHGTPMPVLDQSDDALDFLFAVNVRGIFLAMKIQAEAMIASGGGGAIVNLASVFSHGAQRNMVLYSATKHAVVGLTKGAAIEFADHGIRVNAIAPGPIATPFIGEVTPQLIEIVRRAVPQQRLGEADEVASGVLWLLSPQASYVNGAILDINGGMAGQLPG